MRLWCSGYLPPPQFYHGLWALWIDMQRVAEIDRDSKLRNVTLVATKEHMILRSYVVLMWMHDKRDVVSHVILWNNIKTIKLQWRCRDACEHVIWVPWWFSLMCKTRDVWMGNVITRSKIWIENICFLGFGDIREGVTLRKLVLQTLGCNFIIYKN